RRTQPFSQSGTVKKPSRNVAKDGKAMPARTIGHRSAVSAMPERYSCRSCGTRPKSTIVAQLNASVRTRPSWRPMNAKTNPISSIYVLTAFSGIARYSARAVPKRKVRQDRARARARRARSIAREGRMTAAGRTALGSALRREPLIVAPDVARALRAEPGAFERFERLPVAYKRIRLGFIEGARGRPEVFATRLQYFVRMTAQGKRYGMVRS